MSVKTFTWWAISNRIQLLIGGSFAQQNQRFENNRNRRNDLFIFTFFSFSFFLSFFFSSFFSFFFFFFFPLVIHRAKVKYISKCWAKLVEASPKKCWWNCVVCNYHLHFFRKWIMSWNESERYTGKWNYIPENAMIFRTWRKFYFWNVFKHGAIVT